VEGGGEGLCLPPLLLLREEKGATDTHAGACLDAVRRVVRCSDCSIVRVGWAEERDGSTKPFRASAGERGGFGQVLHPV